MNLQKRFGAALQLVRKKKGLTQEDFSIVSSRTYLSTLERGIKSPTIEKIDQIAGVLEIHPLTLVALSYVDKRTDIPALCKQIMTEAQSLRD